MEFNELKTEILKRAKEASACTEQYKRACRSTNFNELMQVIKDNFDFATRNKIIDPSLIEACKEQFNANQIYCNVDVTEGFLLACDNATVKACDNATVEACDNATVKAWGDAYITSYCTIECKLRDDAIYRIRESDTIRYASDNIKFEKIPAYEPERESN
jgi:hypothetical protein